MMKYILIFLASLLSPAAFALAQTESTNQQNDEALRTAREELRERYSTWANETILPTLKEWKSRLDEGMTPDDLALLNRLRTRATGIRNQIREHRKALRQGWKDEDEEAIRKERTALTEVRKAWLDILTELEPLAFRYRATLKEIGEEGRPLVMEWRKEGKEIFRRWREETGYQTGKGPRYLKEYHESVFWTAVITSRRRRVVRFMLWNGEESAVENSGNTLPLIPDLH